MPKQNQTNITQLKIAEIFDKKGIPIKKQKINNNEPSPIKEMINKIIREFGDYKTNINLLNILSPSDTTRAADIPRPQNSWMLFRKNFSKGLKNANISMTVGNSSIFASNHWQSLSKKEKTFWFDLAKIAKQIHRKKYPNYKFIPVKNQEKMLQMRDSNLEIENSTEITQNIVESTSEVCENIQESIDSYYEIDDTSNFMQDIIYTSSASSEINISNSEINNSHLSSNNDITNDQSFMEIDCLSESVGIDLDDLYLLPTNSIMSNDLNEINIYDPLIDPTLYNLFY